MDMKTLKEMMMQVVNRQPGLLFDLLEAPAGQPTTHSTNSPNWCKCYNCTDMPTDEEKLCCNCLPQNCISMRPVGIIYEIL